MAAEDRESRVARAIGFGAAAAAVGIAAAGAAAGAAVVLARRVVTPVPEPAEPVVVERLQREGDGTIAWIRGEDADLPGRYSLLFDGDAGHARLGPVLTTSRAGRSGAVARRVVGIDRGSLREGVRGRLTGWWYTDPAELGLRTERIAFETELGEAWAWLVHPRRARKRRWAVHVHGRGARPEEAIRGVAPLAEAGITSLVISYRNDVGAPAGEHGRYGNGLAETRDVDAAIAEAVRRGAERITLFGWSMGGTAALLSATRGAHADLVDGVILDSPGLDWTELLRHQADTMRVPRAITDAGLSLLGRGIVRAGVAGGIPFDELSPERFARELRVPVLIHASDSDTFVPSAAAHRLAAASPELVQLRLTADAEHVRLWNVDPEGWESETARFAAALPRPAWRG